MSIDRPSTSKQPVHRVFCLLEKVKNFASCEAVKALLFVRRMPMGGIGGIFNLYFILKLLNS